MNLGQAKALRRRMSDAERRLWYFLRGHRLAGEKFKRQVPIGSYVVDFACLNRKLIIEVDGGQHATRKRDQERDAWLRMQGFEILRFWNNDVLRNTDLVLETIVRTLDERPSPGALRAPPSPHGGEGKDGCRC
jgi:very-short-patch-repair endonuclease